MKLPYLLILITSVFQYPERTLYSVATGKEMTVFGGYSTNKMTIFKCNFSSKKPGDYEDEASPES